MKDAAILSNCPHPEIRKEWIQRILDHDGFEDDAGGIEAWIGLGKAVGLSREEVVSLKYVAPAARFAVDAYVNFARRASWQESIASSLTELFAPHIHQQRLDTWPEKYPWVDAEGMKYFNRALEVKPDHVKALNNLGASYYEMGDFEKARRFYINALSVDPTNAEAILNKAKLDVLNGNFAVGFDGYEQRWSSTEFANSWKKSLKPVWQGQRDKTIINLGRTRHRG